MPLAGTPATIWPYRSPLAASTIHEPESPSTKSIRQRIDMAARQRTWRVFESYNPYFLKGGALR